MRLTRTFKLILFLSLILFYFSGVIVFVLNQWCKKDYGFGLEAPRGTIEVLHLHSISGLWFLILFGYLFHSHVLPGLRRRRKVKSGIFTLLPLGLVIATVPALFYLTDERLKASVAQIHIYVGLLLILPFGIHYLTKDLKPKLNRGTKRT